MRVRRDIWELGDEANPWRDPAIRAYADAISAMQRLDVSDPRNGAGWSNQAAIHERRPGTAPVAGRLENQCQHAGWFFLPWHRMYLFWFEEIVRSHMSAAVAATWALPFWNYSDVAAHRALPPAFRRPRLPDGGPNPLFVDERQRRPLDINGGARLSAVTVRTKAALAPSRFTRSSVGATPGFGGGRTGFHHGTSGGGAGPLEQTPHGDVHVEVGGFDTGVPGFMASFGTAALDPIFWLHHCNLDRLWERWRRAPTRGHPPGANPAVRAFRSRRFEFVRPDDTRVKTAVKDVLDIEGSLGYTYRGLPAPPSPAPGLQPAGDERAETVSAERPPELVGATEGPVTLRGATSSARLLMSEPAGPGRRGLQAARGALPNVYLNLENIEGDVNPGLVYGVYVNLPEGEAAPDSPHLAGTVSFFGIESTGVDDDEGEEAPHELRYVYDITPMVEALRRRGRWNPKELEVTFSPLAVDDDELSDMEIPPVKIGRVSLFVE